MSKDSPTFDSIADQLTIVGTLTSPSELHGLLCGRLSGGLRYQDESWLKAATEFLDPDTAIETEQQTALLDLYRDTVNQLQDQDLSFAPMLPDDDMELSQRIEALGQWCHGFLNGFGTSGVSKDTALSVETAEALRDFAAFVQLDHDADDSEESERDLAEIVEYVRVAALSVFMENAAAKAKSEADGSPSASAPTVH